MIVQKDRIENYLKKNAKGRKKRKKKEKNQNRRILKGAERLFVT